MPNLLHIDDEGEPFKDLEIWFKPLGFCCFYAESCEEGRQEMRHRPIDILILDLKIGDRFAGIDFLIELRKDPETAGIPVIIYSQYLRNHDVQVRLVNAGLHADVLKDKKGRNNYQVLIQKDLTLLEAWVRKLLGPDPERPQWNILRKNGHELKWKREAHEIYLDGERRDLTRGQSKLLEFLYARRGDPQTVQALKKGCWEGKDVDDAAVYRRIEELRKRIEPDPKDPIFLLNDFSWGFKLSDQDDA